MLLAERRAATGVRTLVVRVRHTVARSILEIRGDPMAPTTRMGRVTAAACIAVMGAAGLSACTASGATDGGRTGEEATALPPGILPPNDPPQPGDARLGPDGHYDYSAPDFVLKNPCDTEAYEVALEQGWVPPVVGEKNFDSEKSRVCGIVKGFDGIGIAHHAFSNTELVNMHPGLEYHSDDGTSWYTTVWPNHIGTSCFAGANGPGGAEGVTVPIGGFSSFKTQESACTFASEQYILLFGGIHAFQR